MNKICEGIEMYEIIYKQPNMEISLKQLALKQLGLKEQEVLYNEVSKKKYWKEMLTIMAKVKKSKKLSYRYEQQYCGVETIIYVEQE